MKYVEVILPLRLRTALTYRAEECDGISEGSWVSVPLRGRKALGVVSKVLDKVPDGVPEERLLQALPAPEIPAVERCELDFWHTLAEYYMCTVGEVFKCACNVSLQKGDSGKPVRRRKKKSDAENGGERVLCPLSPAQEKAAGEIREAFGRRKNVLLCGVTGSGKTEIYIHLAEEQLKAGRDVLYLVPEIAVSRQLEERLGRVFGSSLVVFHSQRTVPQRRNAAELLRSKERGAKIVLGTRSAVFLPLRNPGLIVVDEEHDRSYKQDDPAPRYSGRDAAIMLGAQRRVPVLLGSATPSFESLLNVSLGKYDRVDLPVRYHESPDPEIEIIDTVRERRLRNMQGSFSRKLLKEMAAVAKAGGQTLVFRSRRAYAPMVQCAECGAVAVCQECGVSLTYHKFNNTLACHYCGCTVPFTTRCKACGAPALEERGAGTEKLEEELREAFPELRVERFDADTAQSRIQQERLISEFASGAIDIMVGTQMITKGFDFEKLAMVAVVSADGIFSVQDFRSDERALQLITQLTGRSGRRENRGKIVIQTSQPDHPVLRSFAAKEPAGLAGLLEERRQFGFPPFVRMIQITVRDRREGRLWNVCRRIGELARECGIEGVAGPMPAPVEVVGGFHIAEFRIRLDRNRDLKLKKRALSEGIELIERDFNGLADIKIDVDPL